MDEVDSACHRDRSPGKLIRGKTVEGKISIGAFGADRHYYVEDKSVGPRLTPSGNDRWMTAWRSAIGRSRWPMNSLFTATGLRIDAETIQSLHVPRRSVLLAAESTAAALRSYRECLSYRHTIGKCAI